MNIRLKVKWNEFSCKIIYKMNIFNIIIFVTISDEESFYLGTLCTKHKEQKKISWVTFAFGDKK